MGIDWANSVNMLFNADLCGLVHCNSKYIKSRMYEKLIISFLKVSTRYHLKVFREWQAANHIVSLKLSELNLSINNCETNLLSNSNCSSPVASFSINTSNPENSPRVNVNLTSLSLTPETECASINTSSKTTKDSETSTNRESDCSVEEQSINYSSINKAFSSDCVLDVK